MAEIHEEEIRYSHLFIVHMKSIRLLSEFTPSKITYPYFCFKMSFEKGSESSQSLFAVLYTLTDSVNNYWLPMYEHFASSRAGNTTLMGSENIVECKQGATDKHKRIKTSDPGRDQLFSTLSEAPAGWNAILKGGVAFQGCLDSWDLMVQKILLGEPQGCWAALRLSDWCPHPSLPWQSALNQGLPLR